MPTIHALSDDITLEQSFVTGTDRITVNGELVFEGKRSRKEPQLFRAGDREYSVEEVTVGSFTGARVLRLRVQENGETVHEGTYDAAGKPVKPGEADDRAKVMFCAMIGAVVGAAAISFLWSGGKGGGVISSALFGGIRGAVGGFAGYLLGFAGGHVVFGRRPKDA